MNSSRSRWMDMANKRRLLPSDHSQPSKRPATSSPSETCVDGSISSSRDSSRPVADPDPLIATRTRRAQTSPVDNSVWSRPPLFSKLLRGEVPLSKHGRSNKKLYASFTSARAPASCGSSNGMEIATY